MSNTKKVKSFEDNITRLEEIAELLETGELSLDDSLKVYAEAVKLFESCDSKLGEANQKVKLLTATPDGAVTDVPFDTDED